MAYGPERGPARAFWTLGSSILVVLLLLCVYLLVIFAGEQA